MATDNEPLEYLIWLKTNSTHLIWT